MLVLSVLLLCAISVKAFANPACAVCTVAVGASLEIARRLGVDDSVVAVWSGAFLMLLGFWTLKWMDKKGWQFKGRDILVRRIALECRLFLRPQAFDWQSHLITLLLYVTWQLL